MSDIDDLVTNAVPEGRTLEYKETLPGGADSDKKEFLRDVTSFANALGGDIVYGVREKRDAASKPTGLPNDAPGLSGINVDAEIRRLDSIVRTGVAPTIPGYEIRAIEGGSAGPLIVLRIPRSWTSPHMVTHTDSNQFWIRTSAQKQLMRVEELRAAFMLTGSLADRLRRFRDERLGRIIAGDTPLPMPHEGKVVLHLVPIQSLDGQSRIDFTPLKASGIEPMYARAGRGWATRFNLDGLLTSQAIDPAEQEGTSYVQVFRTGAIEAVEAWMIRGQGEDRYVFPEVEQELIRVLNRCLGVLRDAGIPSPVSLLVTMTGVRGFGVGSRPQFRGFGPTTKIDRDLLLLPDVLVDDLSAPADVLLRPILDALWQSAGIEACRHYDNDGRWRMPSR